MVRYTKKAYSTANFACMRGVTDFTNAAQFNLYEGGYSHLFVISMPKYITAIATGSGSGGSGNSSFKPDEDVQKLAETFKYILEYEFKGLDGIDDISTDNLEVTDGISTMNVIGKVTKQSAAEVTMSFTEKSGSAITNFIRYYLEGIKDPRTQAKTYHGLIKSGRMYGGFENEVFTLLYVVTDNTMLQIEKAYLLCNAWPTSAKTSIYNTTKGEIDKKDIDVTFQCFVLDGPEVDKRAKQVLAYTNETDAVKNTYATHDAITGQSELDNISTIKPAAGVTNGKYTALDRTIHLNSSETHGEDKGFNYVATQDDSDIDKYTKS